VNFWDLRQPVKNIALVQAGNNITYTYGQLQTEVDRLAQELDHDKKTLGFIFCKNNLASICGYLAALQQKQAVCLLDANLEKSFAEDLIERYQPDWLWLSQDQRNFDNFKDVFLKEGYVLRKRAASDTHPSLYPDLAVLLSTSGSTGSPKLVRLSYENLQANANSIVEYLGLTEEERPITTLPMYYSYGLSVVNSHLAAGATLLLTEDAIITKPFWDFFQEHGATSLAGVPYTYQMLFRLQLSGMNLPTLKTMTQAGGRLDIKLQHHFAEYASQRNIRFFVMYGQTEATARMSYVPPGKLSDNLGSIGIAIPKGKFEIDAATGELIYYGPNVMLGYAECREDLALEDMQRGRLETGDLARRDPTTGLFYITARKKRFLKLVGLRFNLDEIEQRLEKYCQTNCYCIGEDDHLVVIIPNENLLPKVKSFLSHQLKIRPFLFKIHIELNIPHLPTGKTDYQELQKRFWE